MAVTHVSWLCDQGVFRTNFTGAARQHAVRSAQRMGYELYVAAADLPVVANKLTVTLSITNTGIAPFYYDWPVELGALDAAGALAVTWPTPWKLTSIQPGEVSARWQQQADISGLKPGTYRLLLRVPNPMPGGKLLRFANQTQDQDREGWLTLGAFELREKYHLRPVCVFLRRG